MPLTSSASAVKGKHTHGAHTHTHTGRVGAQGEYQHRPENTQYGKHSRKKEKGGEEKKNATHSSSKKMKQNIRRTKSHKQKGI